MRWIYLSPHLDDAVLSAGGLIHEQTAQGNAVEIWTLMCGFPPNGELTAYASSMHQAWGTGTVEETIALRRQEDTKAASRVRAKTVHFDFLDCIYRRDSEGQALYHDIYSELHEADRELVLQIAETLRSGLKGDDRVVCQLGAGGHIDHLIVRKAAEMLGRPLTYDADVPYVLNLPETLRSKTEGMRQSLEPISEAGLGAWLLAIQGYESQIESLFQSPEMMKQKMRKYWSEQHGILFWSVS
jgi:LmbE family N-acetylglucosaminyl deacetylase